MSRSKGSRVALAVSGAALFAALGGAAHAVSTAPAGSVTSKSIRDGAVAARDLGTPTSLEMASFSGLPTDPEAVDIRPASGPSEESDVSATYLPAPVSISKFRAVATPGVGRSQTYELQVFDGTGPARAVLGCTIYGPDGTCKAPGSANLDAGDAIQIRVLNGANGASHLGAASYAMEMR